MRRAWNHRGHQQGEKVRWSSIYRIRSRQSRLRLATSVRAIISPSKASRFPRPASHSPKSALVRPGPNHKLFIRACMGRTGLTSAWADGALLSSRSFKERARRGSRPLGWYTRISRCGVHYPGTGPSGCVCLRTASSFYCFAQKVSLYQSA